MATPVESSHFFPFPGLLILLAQAGWLSIPFWMAHARRNRIRALASAHGLAYLDKGLPDDFPLTQLLPGNYAGMEPNNVIAGPEGEDELVAFDLGSTYSRNVRPQTIVARRSHRPLPPPRPITDGYAVTRHGQWQAIYIQRSAASRLFQGVMHPSQIELLWKSLG